MEVQSIDGIVAGIDQRLGVCRDLIGKLEGAKAALVGEPPAAGTPSLAAALQPTQHRLRSARTVARARQASGGTKSRVLAALSPDTGRTAGEVAERTGLGRASVSTTLSKLAKAGEIARSPDRGYVSR